MANSANFLAFNSSNLLLLIAIRSSVSCRFNVALRLMAFAISATLLFSDANTVFMANSTEPFMGNDTGTLSVVDLRE